MTEQQLKRIHPLDIPLEVFLADLPTRPCRIIKAEMAYFTHSGDEYIKPPFTVRHLLMFSRKEIRDWPNMGKKSLNEIEEWLRNIGLQLWEQHDERSLRLLRDHPMYYAAPAAEEAPQQDVVAYEMYNPETGHCIVDYSEQTYVGHLSAEKGYKKRPLYAQQQPANMNTHGEPVYAFRRKGLDSFCTCTEKRYNELKAKSNLFEVTVFYTSPQPTPELVQAARMALDALNPRPGMPNPEYESLVACATRELQNALKEST